MQHYFLQININIIQSNYLEHDTFDRLEKTMFCENCGNQIKDTQKFCGVCGTKNKAYDGNATVEDSMPDTVRQAVNGSNKAKEKLYESTYRQAFSLAMQMVKNEQDALDLIQESYIAAFEHLGDLKNPEKFKSWFNCIVANRCRDCLKKKRPQLFTELTTEDEDACFEDTLESEEMSFSPEEYVDYSETKRLMNEILDGLPEEQKLCILMYYYEELSVAEIAEALDCSTGTVKSRLNYARKKIKADVEELERKGTKLYGVAPLPFIVWMLRKNESAISVPSVTPVWNGNAQPQKVVKQAVKTATKKTVKRSIITKVIAGVVGIGVVCGGFAAVYHYLPEKTDESKQIMSENEDVEFVLTEEERNTIELACGWYDELQKQADGYTVRNDYVLELSKNNISTELLNYVASNIVCNDDTLGIEVGIGEFLETQETLTFEECKKILKDTFEYRIDSEEDMSRIFKRFGEDKFLLEASPAADADTLYETKKIVQTEKDEYHFYTNVLGYNSVWSDYMVVGIMNITAHRNKDSKIAGFVFDKVEFVTSDGIGVNDWANSAVENLVRAKAEMADQYYIPEGVYDVNQYTNEEFINYVNMVLSNSNCFQDVMEMETYEGGMYAGYRLPISIYKEACEKTIGRTEDYDITYQNEIEDEEVTFGGVMFDAWYDVVDEYVYQYLDGTIEINGSLKDYCNSGVEYSFKAYGYASEKSKSGMVIERVEIDNYLEKWQIAYMNWILQWDSDTTFELFDLNGDEIPEIAAIGVCMADGTTVATYGSGEVQELEIYRCEAHYIEGKNILDNSGGSMDEYYDRIFEIKDGKWLQIASGKYGAENNDDIQEDENGEPIYVYEWEGKLVDKEEYIENVNDLIDIDTAETITYDGVSAQIIVQEIINY